MRKSKLNKVKRSVTVRMMNLRWFLKPGESKFAGLAYILCRAPSLAVYKTDFVECIMQEFWDDYKKIILKSQFYPFLVVMISTIYYYNFAFHSFIWERRMFLDDPNKLKEE